MESQPGQDVLHGLSLDDITIDRDGRPVISNPDVAARLRGLKSFEYASDTNTNCGVATCNTVAHCGHIDERTLAPR